MSDYIDLITGKPLELWAEQAMKDRASSKAGAVERAREVARDLRLRLSAMGINLTDDARTAINQAFLALPTTMAGDYVMVRRAAIATLEQMTKEFGWRPDADRGETVSDDPDCQITWGALHDLHHAIVALPSTDYVMVPRADALAQALCLLDTFAGEGLAHTYGNGQALDAADVCTELAEAYGIECDPGWWRTVANRTTSPTGGE